MAEFWISLNYSLTTVCNYESDECASGPTDGPCEVKGINYVCKLKTGQYKTCELFSMIIHASLQTSGRFWAY